jgi:hypothetical protein
MTGAQLAIEAPFGLIRFARLEWIVQRKFHGRIA